MRHDDIREMLREEGADAIAWFTDCLSPREKRVVELLYVPDENGQTRSLDEAARDFNVIKARVIQIERAAIQSIAGYMRRREFRKYFDDEASE
jgi:DNA-directed RNA polymerase sigma subunit (sigma70/sigma32)